MDQALFETILSSIGDAVIATDASGNITFMNAEAERLTGWGAQEATGVPLPSVFRIIQENTRQPVQNPVQKVTRSGRTVVLEAHTLLLAKDGREIPIDDTAAPIRHRDGPLIGVVLVFRDVTEQRTAEKAKAHLAAIVQYSGDVVITKNLDGIIQSWNASAERLFGYTAAEIVGKHVTVLFPADRLTEEDHILGRLRQGRPIERLETIRLAKGGRPIPVSVSVSPLRNEEGQIVGASKIIHDITELVAAREALIHEKEVLATTLASIGDGVIVTDAHGRIKFLNAEAESLTQWKTHEAFGRPLKEVFRIINEHSREPVEDPVEKVLRLGKTVALANHTLLIAKGGTEIPIDDSAAPIRRPEGPLLGVVLVFRDFTARKELEAQLQALALYPAQNPAPILRLARNGDLLHANPAALTILNGYALALGKPSPEPLRTFAAEAFRSRSSLQREITANGHIYLMTIVPAPGLEYANVYGADITQGRLAQKQLQLAHAQLADRALQLEELVADRTAKLSEMVNELRQVSYAIVHDMRAPLRAMNTFAHEILDGLAANSPLPSLQEDCRRIINAAARLDKLIQDTLNYTRSVLGDVKMRPVDLSTLIPGLIESYPNLQTHRAQITIENPLPIVLGEESLLTQCFSNLLGNAVKFVPKGVRPQVRIRTQTLHDNTTRLAGSNTWYRISIQDNGIGIPEQARDRVFEMFERLTRDYEGTGIGLAIVRKVVERMQGRVSFESVPGKGTCFFLDLPPAESCEDSRSVHLSATTLSSTRPA